MSADMESRDDKAPSIPPAPHMLRRHHGEEWGTMRFVPFSWVCTMYYVRYVPTPSSVCPRPCFVHHRLSLHKSSFHGSHHHRSKGQARPGSAQPLAPCTHTHDTTSMMLFSFSPPWPTTPTRFETRGVDCWSLSYGWSSCSFYCLVHPTYVHLRIGRIACPFCRDFVRWRWSMEEYIVHKYIHTTNAMPGREDPLQ
jgi:hypothetical protein